MGNIPHFSLIMTGFCSFTPQRMQSALQARKMRCFEEESGIPMLDTLSAYAAAHGSVEQAAKRIYQHPNTVRNRVKKARALLALDGDWYEQIFILMGLYALEQA